MKIFPAKNKKTQGELDYEALTPKQQVLKGIALVAAFISVFFFFIKILFL